MMRTDELLRIARDIINKVPSCMAITVDGNGDANARVVDPRPLSDAWTVRFATHRQSRKSAEIEQSGRLTLAYQHVAEKAYVSLIGRATIGEDVAAKTAGSGPPLATCEPRGSEKRAAASRFSKARISFFSWSSGGCRLAGRQQQDVRAAVGRA
jgi:pyridoxine/pyridoxamine 5'-phosphate oxidase